MRLLLTVVLAHCFSSTFLKESEVQFETGSMHNKWEGNLSLIELNAVKSTNETRSKNYSCTFSSKECRCVKFDQLVARHDDRGLFYAKSSNNRQRKLLSFFDKTVYENSMKNKRLHRGTILDEEEKGDSLFRSEITTETENGVWDDWGNWSTCSVTCGSGRRVRWRHCSGNNCAKGLKKAQIKACHLKKCETNILNWLGIRTR